MDYTYLDYFNYYLKEFLNELISKFPGTEKKILPNYRDLLEGKADKNDLYVKYYYTKINSHLISIAKKDSDLFSNPGIILIEGVDLHQIWNSDQATDNNKKAIWKYLQILMLLGRKIIPNHQEILDMLKKVGGEISVPAKVEKTLAELDEEEKKEAEQANGFDINKLMGMASGLGGGLGGGSGGDVGADLGNIMKTLSETLGNIDIPEMPNDTNQSETINVEDGSTKENESTEESSSGETNNSSSGTDNLIGSKLFNDLAQEMSEVFDFSELEKEENKPKNVGEAMQNLMQGNNPAKLMNLVNKFGQQLQNDISTGKVKQEDLLKDTMQMMNNLQQGSQNPDLLKKQAEQMLNKNPKLRQQYGQMEQNNKERERLKKKIEENRKN